MLLGLAPMDGFTDCAFRQIVKEIFDKYGEKDNYELVLWTEFMNADGYIINPPGVIKHLLSDNYQSPVIAQIFGGNEEMLTKCFADIQKKYGKIEKLKNGKMEDDSLNGKLKIENGKFIFAGIELNMGCPARNVMNTGGGSALLKDKKNSLAIIKKLSGVVTMPLSIKTRTGIDTDDKKNQMEFLKEVSKYVSMITIHGRTVKQAYTGDADWDFIYDVKSNVDKHCKIIGNGGIKSYEEIVSHYEGNGAILDGIMIGQAAVGNPRIFTPHIPSKEEIKEVILRHLDYMISYENYFQEQKVKYKHILTMPKHLKMNVKNPQAITLAEFRKHLFQYVKGIPGSKEFKQKVATIVDYNQLVKEIQEFFV